jgi:hypothetical protein
MIPGLDSLSVSAGGGGPSTAGANNGISLPFSLPFNFDHSGFVVQSGSASGAITATGNKEANNTTQTASPNGGASSGSGLLAGSVAGLPIPLILLGLGAWFVLKSQ